MLERAKSIDAIFAMMTIEMITPRYAMPHVQIITSE